MRSSHLPPLLTLALLSTSLYAAAPHAHTPKPADPATTPPKSNPLLPHQIPLESFLLDLSLTQKSPATTTDIAGFDALYDSAEWDAYRTKFGNEADQLPKKKSSDLIKFSQKLIDAANDTAANPEGKGYPRLLLLRAVIDCYRTRGGFETANKAVLAYLKIMDIHSPIQVAALWTIANAMSRSITTPKPDRIHYSAIAARANMQLTILLLDNDQLDAAQSLQKLIGYHEGWLHTANTSPADRVAYTQIAQVRALVKQTTATLDFLATQYQPAIDGDDNALMAIYLYGRYVRQKPEIVADLPGRKPSSPLAQLAATLDAVDRKTDPTAPYTAAETLKIVASTLPEPGAGVLKQRTLYAALQNYRAFIADPRTEHDRVKRTLARMAIESAISDGAHGPSPVVNPFAPPPPPTTQPTTQPSDAETAHIPEETPPPSTQPTTPPAPVPTPRPAPTLEPLSPSTPSMPALTTTPATDGTTRHDH